MTDPYVVETRCDPTRHNYNKGLFTELDISIIIDMFLPMDITATSSAQQLTTVFQALADQRRLEIIRLLTGGERCVCDLTEVVGAQQSLLSFHLKTLKSAELVKDRRVGKWIYYSLDYQTLDQLHALLGVLLGGREHFGSCCCESLCKPSDQSAGPGRETND